MISIIINRVPSILDNQKVWSKLTHERGGEV